MHFLGLRHVTAGISPILYFGLFTFMPNPAILCFKDGDCETQEPEHSLNPPQKMCLHFRFVIELWKVLIYNLVPRAFP